MSLIKRNSPGEWSLFIGLQGSMKISHASRMNKGDNDEKKNLCQMSMIKRYSPGY